MKFIGAVVIAVVLLCTPMTAYAETAQADEPISIPEEFDMEQQLDALGKEELLREVPDDARALLRESNVDDLSVDSLLTLSPRDFFDTVWNLLIQQAKKPIRTLGVIVAVVLVCALLDGMKRSGADSTMHSLFTTVAVLCILTSAILPILDCIMQTSASLKEASTFLLAFIPILSAAITAAGQPVTGTAYHLFLFSTCQAVSQIAAQTLVPMMGIYLALCVVGALTPEIRIGSVAAAVKSVVSWGLGLTVTLFVGLLSFQTLVSGSADQLSVRAARFLVGSFVPVVGGTLSEALGTATGCLRLIKTAVGVYGILAAAMIFLPGILQTVLWCLVTRAAAIAGDVLGVERIAEVLRGVSAVLGMLLSVLLCFALLVIVSTAIVLAAGMGG